MHDLLLIAAGVLVTLVAVGGWRRLLPSTIRSVGRRIVAEVITLDDFKPTPAQEDQIRRAVTAFGRQLTPTTMKPCRVSPGGLTYDFDGPRAPAGRLFGVVRGDQIVMFHQVRHATTNGAAKREVLASYWARFADAVDAAGWPTKPDKIFELNPGSYGPLERDDSVAWEPDRMHPVLRQEVELA